VVIKPVGSFGSILGVDDKGRLTAIDGDAPHTLFVLVPAGNGKHLIRTATGDAGGEPSCLGVKGNGSNPLTVVAAACDTRRAGQLFGITGADGTEDGLPTYAIDNQGAFVQLSPQHGVIAEELGDSPLRTTYTFVDNGAAPAFPGS
jgi:hypothetical protein